MGAPFMTKVLDPMSTTRRRRWPIFLPAALLILLAGLWTGFWFFASAKAETTLAGWREREAKSGRIYSCDKQTVGGYPFRIEVRCTDPTAELRTTEPPVSLKAGSARCRPGLRPEPAAQRNPGAGDDRRAWQAAGLCGQLEARPVERARHAGGPRADFVLLRDADG